MHVMLLSFSSCTPVLILKCQTLKFSQTINFSQVNQFFVYTEVQRRRHANNANALIDGLSSKEKSGLMTKPTMWLCA